MPVPFAFPEPAILGSPQEFVKLTSGRDLSVLASLGLVGAGVQIPRVNNSVLIAGFPGVGKPVYWTGRSYVWPGTFAHSCR